MTDALTKEQRAERAHEITARMNEARKAESSLWPHQAQAVFDIRESDGWEDLGLKSFNEWCAQLDVPIGREKAKKLAATIAAFLAVGYDDLEELGTANYSKLSVTAACVRRELLEPDEAIAMARTTPKPELEIECAEIITAADEGRKPVKFDADAEPDKWRCPHCHTVKARKPKHLEESSDDPGEVDS